MAFYWPLLMVLEQTHGFKYRFNDLLSRHIVRIVHKLFSLLILTCLYCLFGTKTHGFQATSTVFLRFCEEENQFGQNPTFLLSFNVKYSSNAKIQ